MEQERMTGQEALTWLLAGNDRYCRGEGRPHPTREQIAALSEVQTPFAAVMGCADSRVPPNLVFDCSLGELFTVRTAGNVLSQMDLGSIEYAVTALEVPLVMVLGHSGCGAVASAMQGGPVSEALGALLAEITPAVEWARNRTFDPAEIVSLAENRNIWRGVRKLRGNPVLRAHPETLVVGAKYDIRTGRVTVLPETR